ncbi:MAG: hypothetical protein U5M53_13315 [Rhodoferax sp.]|nr:hypothetical protein [Rhodoferax sp.]
MRARAGEARTPKRDPAAMNLAVVTSCKRRCGKQWTERAGADL